MWLENLWTVEMRDEMKTLKELETCLGDYHDLVLLLEKMNTKRADFKPNRLELFQSAADIIRRCLRERAVFLGDAIYRERPRDFLERVSKQWDAWQKGLSVSSMQRRRRSSSLP